MKNKLGYLGFLGLIGLLGFLTENKTYIFFFTFLIYFRYFRVIPDELFKQNVQKAATPAFFTGTAIFVFTAGLTAFSVSTLFFATGMVIGFAASFMVFTIILASSEIKERSES